jgi:Protein kinase domain/WD40-like Beta Propeller Repeat
VRRRRNAPSRSRVAARAGARRHPQSARTYSDGRPGARTAVGRPPNRRLLRPIAHWRRLGRDVAIKILPSAFSSSPERIARFEREARLLASLNHPRIGAIYGVEEAEGVRALVLELIEGSTLAKRLAEGRLPVAEALPIARQIAEALEAAHDKGIIHRDLKPANIKIAPDGQVKVLDFGIAKVMESGSIDEASRAPTMTSTGTAAGMVVGTPAYMSPEQIRGEAFDRRADTWAFGCVLFEMLAGRRAFDANSNADTVASVLERSPDWGLPPDMPAPVRRLLRRCLEKDCQQRLADIADARLEIDEALAPSSRDETGGARRPPADVALILTIAAGALVVAAAAGLYWFQPAATPEAMRLSVTLPANTRFQVAMHRHDGQGGDVRLFDPARAAMPRFTFDPAQDDASPVWSPDGQRVAYASIREGKWGIYQKAANCCPDESAVHVRPAADAVQREPWPGVARRQMVHLSIERERTERGVRRRLSGGGAPSCRSPRTGAPRRVGARTDARSSMPKSWQPQSTSC